MNEVINSILEAEKKAENILKASSEQAKQITKESILKSDSIKQEAISSFKLERKTEIKKAEEKAEKEYNKKIENGTIESDALINSVRPKIKQIVNEQLKDIMG